ncbi:MAG: UvrB/UvrC motif-containing protein [Chthoniobacteraceae bacterium]
MKDRKPLTKLEQLERDMARAIANEAYEQAAELRDKIRAYQHQKEG